MPYMPYSCPECGADLGEPGAVVFWCELPEKAAAHIEPGEDGVIVALDGADEESEIYLQCFNCGEDLSFEIEEVCIDPDFELREE